MVIVIGCVAGLISGVVVMVTIMLLTRGDSSEIGTNTTTIVPEIPMTGRSLMLFFLAKLFLNPKILDIFHDELPQQPPSVMLFPCMTF